MRTHHESIDYIIVVFAKVIDKSEPLFLIYIKKNYICTFKIW